MKDVSPIKRKNKSVTTKGLLLFFILFFLANLIVGVVLAAATGGDSWKMILFHSGFSTDMYMDFFNSIRDGGSPDVYSARNNIYPPLCNLIFRFFSKLISPSLVSTAFASRTSLQVDQISMMIYLLFAIVCIVCMLRLIESYVNIQNDGKIRLTASLFSFLMIISYPVMFCLERGNILILSVITSMFFLFFRNSENPVIRELSYISLAVAAGIKLYPAVFGLIFLIEKKYKEALRLILYGLIVVVFPIVFFLDEFIPAQAHITGYAALLNITAADSGSASVLMKIIQNLFSFTVNKKSSLNLSSVSVQNIAFILGKSTASAKILCAITELIALICAFFAKREWQRVFLLTYLMLNIPSASNSYALSFMLISFCIFLFGTEKRRSIDKIYIFIYALLLTPLPTYWYFHPEFGEKICAWLGVYYSTLPNQVIATYVFQFMFLLTVFDILYFLLKPLKKKVMDSNQNAETPQAPHSSDSTEESAA